jgi:hypothetical protein
LFRRDQHTFVWISPLGRKYVVEIEPIAPPLPAPMPRTQPPEAWESDVDPPDPGPILDLPKPPEPQPPGPITPAYEPPPF